MNKPQFSLQATSAEANFGRFVLEPLPQGYGHTLGNALRRILYSSIPGAAITSVQIAGVSHQFTTIEGVREDMVQLILNLKQIAVAYTGGAHTGDKPVKISLSAKGKTEVTAADFDLPAEVTVANPGQIVAHLADSKSKLEITAAVETGFGYSPADDRKSTTLGVIPIDAQFSPVIRVNYTIEATRVGRLTNYDKLTLEITTNGTISPQTALTSAAQTLVDYFTAVVNPEVPPQLDKSGTFSRSSSQSGAGLSIEELDLPTRITNALQKAGFDTVTSLLSTPRSQLAKVKNLGVKSVKIIELALKDRGFELALD